MTTMKLFKSIILITALSFAFVSCDDWLDVNTDPNAATEVSPDLLFSTVLANVASNRAIEIQPSGSFFINAWAPNGSTPVFINPDRYIISPFSTGNTWSNWYGASMRNLSFMIDEAETNELVSLNVAAQAKIMKAYLFWSITMMWEDVPFTQSQKPEEFPEPAFDDQETVLRGVIDLLDEALSQIDLSESGVGNRDYVYEGNMLGWLKFANSLKLRTYIFLRNQDPSVDSAIADLLNNAELIRENADEAAIPFFDSNENAHNLWVLNNLFGGFTGAANGNIFVFAGQTLVDIMNELEDPRRKTYFSYATFSNNLVADEFIGQEAGVSGWGGETSMVSQNIIRRTWPSRMLTASEVLFYEAEFLATTGDLGGAHQAFVDGVRASLEFLSPYTELDPAGGELEDQGISEEEIAVYLNNLPSSFSNETEALEAIWTQAYIEVLDRAPENWSHWRRVKFPELSVAQNANLGDIIRRFPYPPSEIAANPNTPQDPALDTPMWFEN